MGIPEVPRGRLGTAWTAKAALIAIGLWILATAAGCNYGKMNYDDAINPYQTSLPQMPEGSVPTEGGITVVKNTDPRDLHNPFPINADSLERGRWVYNNFCVQCHGPRQDGNGTVGQSFAPLPADWHSNRVQGQSDGQLFIKVSLGYLRMPPLYSTVSVDDRWYVIDFMRSLNKQNMGRR